MTSSHDLDGRFDRRHCTSSNGSDGLTISSLGSARLLTALTEVASGAVVASRERLCDLEGAESSTRDTVIAVPRRVRWEVLLLLGLVFAGVTGNLLVCVAVFVERKLRNVTNYFLVSLAVADMCVSLVVMPCCIVQEFLGYWPFGLGLCNAYQFIDVTMCTSSIMHICTVSLDRYAGIRTPLKTRNRSRFVIVLKIIGVWIISVIIACPLIFIGIYRPDDILSTNGHCAVFNSYFLIYGSLSAFFGPLGVMIITYSLTIRLLSRRAHQVEIIARQGMRRSIIRHRLSSVSQNSNTANEMNNLQKLAAKSGWKDCNSSTDNNEAGVLSAGTRRNADDASSGLVPSGANNSWNSELPVSEMPAISSSPHLSHVKPAKKGRRPRLLNSVPNVASKAGLTSPSLSSIRFHTDCESASIANSTIASSSVSNVLGVTEVREATPETTVLKRRFKQRRRLPALRATTTAAVAATTGAASDGSKLPKRSNDTLNATPGLPVRTASMLRYTVSASISLPAFPNWLRSPTFARSERFCDVRISSRCQQQVRLSPTKIGGEEVGHKVVSSRSRRFLFEPKHCHTSSKNLASDIDSGTPVVPGSRVPSYRTARSAIDAFKEPTKQTSAPSRSSKSGVGRKLTSRPLWLLRRRRRNHSNNSLNASGQWTTSSLGSAESAASTDIEMQPTTSGEDSSVLPSTSITSPAPSTVLLIDGFSSRTSSGQHYDDSTDSSSAIYNIGQPIDTDTDSTATRSDSSVILHLRRLVRKQHDSFKSVTSSLVSRVASRRDGTTAQVMSQLKSVKTERKAVKVLGTMFLLFVASWASFFTMNLAMGVCSTCVFDELVFKWFLWLGYSSSILNPIVYTVFNRAFKRTFVRLLTCSAIPVPHRRRPMAAVDVRRVSEHEGRQSVGGDEGAGGCGRR